MSQRLGVKAGDWIDVKVLYPEERISRIRVTAVMEQYMGTTAYLSPEGLAKISEYRNVSTGIYIKAAKDAQEELWKSFDGAPLVTGIESRTAKLDNWRSLMGSFTVMIGSMVILGILIGLAVLYTSALISFEELKRELSVMRMLGLTAKECLEVISVGQWILTAGGILLGIPMTLWMSHMLAVSMSAKMYSIPDFVDAASVLEAIVLMGRCCIYQFTIDSEKTKSGITGIASDGEGIKMKKKVKLILAGAAVIVLAAVGLYVLLSPVSVETEIMEKADLTETFTASPP